MLNTSKKQSLIFFGRKNNIDHVVLVLFLLRNCFLCVFHRRRNVDDESTREKRTHNRERKKKAYIFFDACKDSI